MITVVPLSEDVSPTESLTEDEMNELLKPVSNEAAWRRKQRQVIRAARQKNEERDRIRDELFDEKQKYVELEKKYTALMCQVHNTANIGCTLDSESLTLEKQTTTYNVNMEVSIGTYVVLQKWCSPEFAIEICDLKPSKMGCEVPKNRIWTVEQKMVFEDLENIYADKLWNAMKRAKKRRGLYFNFRRSDFEGRFHRYPRALCAFFLSELCRSDENGACPKSKGKFFGMHFDVWGNGAFTTYFTW